MKNILHWFRRSKVGDEAKVQDKIQHIGDVKALPGLVHLSLLPKVGVQYEARYAVMIGKDVRITSIRVAPWEGDTPEDTANLFVDNVGTAKGQRIKLDEAGLQTDYTISNMELAVKQVNMNLDELQKIEGFPNTPGVLCLLVDGKGIQWAGFKEGKELTKKEQDDFCKHAQKFIRKGKLKSVVGASDEAMAEMDAFLKNIDRKGDKPKKK
jgi:hypothetical protein